MNVCWQHEWNMETKPSKCFNSVKKSRILTTPGPKITQRSSFLSVQKKDSNKSVLQGLLIHSYTTYGKMFQEHTHTALGANAHKHRCWGAHVHTHIQQRKWPHAAQRNCCCSTLHSQPHSWVPCRHSCTMWQECAVSVAVSLVKGSLN